MRAILVFLDGVGLGGDDPEHNPLARRGTTPMLERLAGCRLLARAFPWTGECGGGVAIDATFGVPGLPQSATGQVSLLTGLNAPAIVGRHQNGFPGAKLRQLLSEHSIFQRLRKTGLPATFANAFTAEYFAAVATGRWHHSATTLAALAGGVTLRFLPELRAGRAVYQDLTCETLRERGYDVPLASPEEAGLCLARLARDYSFTLFEYFQTDVAGHQGEMRPAVGRLREVDRFLGSLLKVIDREDMLLAVTSDHGNVEDLGTRGHTANPVPALAFGRRHRTFLSGLTSLDEVTPRLLAALAGDLGA